MVIAFKKDISRDQINTIEALWAEACFCSGDKYVNLLTMTIEMIRIGALLVNIVNKKMNNEHDDDQVEQVQHRGA